MTDKEYAEFDYPHFVECLRSMGAGGLDNMLHSAVGISGESGELLDHMKKVIWQDHPLDKNYVLYELGDILFYLTSMCNCVGTDIDTVRRLNIKKLQKRYPDGVFDKDRSINRDG